MKQVFLALGLLLVFSQPAAAQTTEHIDQFNFVVRANADATLDVTEQIAYDFGPVQHHGIFRDIPYRYQRNGINYTIKISDIAVTDENSQPYQFTTDKSGGNLEIKIGDPDTYVSGLKKYIISYRVRNAVNYFDDHDEVYWNAVGSDWQVPINSATGTVIIPPTDAQNLPVECFTGAVGETTMCNGSTAAQNYPDFPPYADANAGGTAINFQQSQIAPGQGMTIAVSLPKGVLFQPSRWQVLWFTVEDNLIFLLPILALAVMWWIWRVFGRDPKPAIPVVAQYAAPDGLTPIEVGYLADERTQNSDVAAEIIYLATLGYLRIERIPKEGLFGREDFKLFKLKPETDLPNEFDRNLLQKLFSQGDEILLSKLKTSSRINQSTLKVGQVGKKLTTAGYFTKNPNTVRFEYITAAGVIAFLCIYFFATYAQWSVTLSVVLSAVIVAVFGYFMPRATQQGADAKQLVAGLKLYLSVSEKDRLDFHNDPEKDPQLFEKLLPFAIALGVSAAWAKKFEGLFDYQPGWYSDPAHAYFNFILFNSLISNFNSGFNTAVGTASRGAGAGRSGFGGGGFSGGGFGGGGGGSW